MKAVKISKLVSEQAEQDKQKMWDRKISKFMLVGYLLLNLVGWLYWTFGGNV